MLLNSRTNRIQQRDQILNKIPIFLAKTYRIVDHPDYKDIIEWLPAGDSFIVKNISRLTTQVFPRHFKHNNFLSFIRQLNMYGFHKIVTPDQEVEGSVFKQECFKRDDFSLLPLIKRKNTSEEGESQQIVAVPNREERLEQEVNLLRSQHKELQSMMEALMEQNKTITAQNKTFLTVMTDMREKYRKKLETLMLLFLFGKKNKPDEFLFPPQLNSLIETFEQINNGHSLRMLPSKQIKQNPLPMLTQGEGSHNYSDGQRSEIASNFDKEESEDIFKVLNRSKSNYLSKMKSQEQQKLQKQDQELWKNTIPVSPLSAYSMPQQMQEPDEWDQEMLRRLQNSDNEQEQAVKP